MVLHLFVLLSNNGCPFTSFIAQSHNTQAYYIILNWKLVYKSFFRQIYFPKLCAQETKET